jgi:hypothetical protein
MAIPQLQVSDFMSVFKGNIHNYGQHVYKYIEGEEKENGTNATIKNKLVTEATFKDHLNGKKGLGIIPINEENKCYFAVIDVDIYKVNLNMYVDAIEKNNFPLVPFKSKSGGLHIYCFFKNPVDAKAAVDIMRKMAAVLSIDLLVKNTENRMVEIFPKQYKLDKNKVGSWINLPYYDAGGPSRQCAMKDGKELSLSEALLLIKEKRSTLNEIRSFLDELPHKDGPPCLQSIYILNSLDKNSGRNNYLFSFGVYLKKKDENFFEQALFEINRTLSKPLTGEELERTILSSLRRKDYQYKCNESPCVDYCKKKVCKTRDFGVGKDGGYFSNLDYGELIQYKTHEPYYEWDIKLQEVDGFKKLRFKNEDEIIKQDAFLKLCFRELHVLPTKLKPSEWFKIINQSLEELKIEEVDVDSDTSSMSMFRSIFFEFLLNRAMAATKDQILTKRVYFDATKDEYYFRTKDLMDYLFLAKNFRQFTSGEIHGVLRDMGCRTIRIRTESDKQLRVIAIDRPSVDEQISVKDVPYVADFEKELEEEF